MITIIKLDPSGIEQTRYNGTTLKYLANGVVIEAIWTRPDRDLGYVCFERGDRFVEYFYGDRWFNVFEIISSNRVRKGWYCNVAEPARITEDVVMQVDLYLDVWVDVTGKVLVLDEDEFEGAVLLDEGRRLGAREGLQELLRMVAGREEMFGGIGG